MLFPIQQTGRWSPLTTTYISQGVETTKQISWLFEVKWIAQVNLSTTCINLSFPGCTTVSTQRYITIYDYIQLYIYIYVCYIYIYIYIYIFSLKHNHLPTTPNSPPRHVLLGTGEVYLDCVLHDLRRFPRDNWGETINKKSIKYNEMLFPLVFPWLFP